MNQAETRDFPETEVLVDMSPAAFAETEDMLELDDLLAESVKKPELDELDALLQESVGLKEEEAHVKYLRERAKRGGLTAAQLKEDEARIREWEARREWEIKANIGVFEERTCACGTVETVWVGLMHFRQHREKKVSSQVRATEAIASLPNMIAKQQTRVPCCSACATGKGWDLSGEVNFVWSTPA